MRAWGVTAEPRALAACAVAALVLAPGLARANGVFPTAAQLVVDPDDAAHLVVVATYGILSTRDGGAAWDWTCEEAAGYSTGYHPPIAITAGGAILAGAVGLRIARGEACDWASAPEIGDGFVVDVSAEKADPSRAVALVSRGAGVGNEVWQTVDAAQSFAQAGVALPSNLLGATIDVAPSEPQRIYVSGLVGSPGSLKGTLARSDDGGQSWSLHPVPGADASQSPYIAAIDPASPDRVYVRLTGAPGRLLVTEDGGGSFAEVFTGAGFLRAFALSPDGATVIVGGDTDGLWSAPAATLAFTPLSAVGARCLAWTTAALYACSTETKDGFVVGVSTDGGATFAPLLHQACIRGPLGCAAGTAVGDACPAAGPTGAAQIGATGCGGGGGAGGEGGGAASSSSGASAAGGGGAAAPASPSGEEEQGCGCRVVGAARGEPGPDERAGSGPSGSAAALAWLVAALAAIRRSPRRRAGAPHPVSRARDEQADPRALRRRAPRSRTGA